MKNNKIIKRVLGIMLAAALIIGTVNVSGFYYAKASESPEVTLTLSSAVTGGTWTFGHSVLSEAYQGNSSSWSTVRYQFDAYKDGNTEPENMWIEFVGETAYFWGESHFASKTPPITSLQIPAGTVLTQCTVSGTGADGDPIQWEAVAGGKTMTLKEEVKIVNADGTWQQQTSGEEPPMVEYNDVKISFQKAEGVGFYFNAEIVSGPDAGKAITSVYGDWGTIADGLFTFTRNDMEENMSVLWCPCSPNQIYLSGDYQHYVSELTKIVIAEGTVLTPRAGSSSMTPLRIANAITLDRGIDGWKSNEPVVIPEVTNDIRITYDRVEGAGFYVKTEIVAGPDAGKNVADVYGDWGMPLKGMMYFVRNGENDKMNVLWCTCNQNEIYIIGDYQHYVNELTNIWLKQDTVLTPQSETKSQVPLRVVNELKLQKYTQYGVWGPEGMITDDTKFNDVKLTFASFDGRGFYFHAEIIAGPDAGKNIADIYGDWANPSPSGNMTFQTADAETTMNVLWCPCNSNQLYVVGNYQDYALELTHVTLAANTLIIPTMEGKSKTFIRIVNEVKLEKESVYGLWGVEGEVKTPTEFCDVLIEVKQLKGHALTLNVKAADGREISLNNIYGPQASVWGAVVLGDESGVYTDRRAVYTIEGGAFRLFGILPATKESIKIEAGTVLFAHNACKTSLPIRILNTVELSRDGEDEWVWQNGAKEIISNGSNPATGDTVNVTLYIVLLAVSSGLLAVLCQAKRRRRR